jgi:hypothetical protein
MSAVEVIEERIKQLPAAEVAELRDWLDDYLEDLQPLSPEFVASIERGQRDLKDGRVRVENP